jgi:hypothetical protein
MTVCVTTVQHVTVPVFLPTVWQASSLPIVRPVCEAARVRDHALHAPRLRALFSARDGALSGDQHRQQEPRRERPRKGAGTRHNAPGGVAHALVPVAGSLKLPYRGGTERRPVGGAVRSRKSLRAEGVAAVSSWSAVALAVESVMRAWG